MLPKLRRKSLTNEWNYNSCNEVDKSEDYVFRIVPTSTTHLPINKTNDFDETTTHETSKINDPIIQLRFVVLSSKKNLLPFQQQFINLMK